MLVQVLVPLWVSRWVQLMVLLSACQSVQLEPEWVQLLVWPLEMEMG